MIESLENVHLLKDRLGITVQGLLLDYFNSNLVRGAVTRTRPGRLFDLAE